MATRVAAQGLDSRQTRIGAVFAAIDRETMKQLAGWLLLGLVACGGKYQDPGPGSGTGEPASSSTDGGAGKVGSSPGTGSLPSHDLGVCKPGFGRAENPTRACNWLSDAGICFDTDDDACACICPTDHDSVCWSPFDNGPGSATLVHCE